MISSQHAAKRIAQASAICMKMVAEHEQEAKQDFEAATEAGFEVEINPVGIPDIEDSVYWVWHRYIQFYSQFL